MSVLLACLAAADAGCEKVVKSFSELRKEMRKEEPTFEEQVQMLYEGKTPDERREGIAFISSHPWGLQEPHLARYAELLRDDADASVRSAAARALGRSAEAKYVTAVAAALADTSDSVRWDAAVALDRLVGPSALDSLKEHAILDSSPDVRAACAKALRHYEPDQVDITLIKCLRDEAFAVRHQAHASLVELTGRDEGYEPGAWVASRGDAVATTRPAEKRKKPWWDLLGVTGRGGDKKPKPAKAEEKKKPARPWWDWLGVTKKDAKDQDKRAPETQPADAGP